MTYAPTKRPGVEHERLVTALVAQAASRGFTFNTRAMAGTGKNPDVVLANSPRLCVLVGDAKDANHETARRGDTRNRIEGYVRSITNWTAGDPERSCYVAIITNSYEAAWEWAIELARMAREANLTRVANGLPLEFHVTELDGHTWLIHHGFV